MVCFSHLQSTLFGVEPTRENPPVSTGGRDQEARRLAVIHISTAVRTQSCDRRTRSEWAGNDTEAVTALLPLWCKDFPLLRAAACGATQGARPHVLLFVTPPASSPGSSSTLCLLSFLTLKSSQLLDSLWLPVITNKQSFSHD